MTTDSRLDYIISRIDDVADRLARLEQLTADHLTHSTERSGFWRWAVPTLLSVGALLLTGSKLVWK